MKVNKGQGEWEANMRGLWIFLVIGIISHPIAYGREIMRSTFRRYL